MSMDIDALVESLSPEKLQKFESAWRAEQKAKLESGIDFWEPYTTKDGRKPQEDILKDQARIRVAMGGSRCLDGETVVSLDGRKVKDIKGAFWCLAWDGEKLKPARANKPFIKAKEDDFYRIKFTSGSEIKVTGGHLFLTRDGWTSISSLLPDFALCPRGTIEVFSPQAQRQDGRRWTERLSGSQDDYSQDSRPCDGPLLPASENDQVSLPSPGYAPGHSGESVYPFFWPEDDRDGRGECTHVYPRYGHLSMKDVFPREPSLLAGSLSRGSGKTTSRPAPSCRTEKLPTSRSVLQLQSIGGPDPRANSVSSDPMAWKPSWVGIVSVSHLFPPGGGDVWDFEVPEYHNYFAGGVLNHNSGKTITGAADAVLTAIGKHPYRKNRVGRKIVWVASHTNAKNKDIFEPYFESLIPKRLLKRALVKGSKEIPERYIFKDGTQIVFKSFEAKREAFQGVAVDLIWLDEEPPEDIFTECLMRGATVNGSILMTMTADHGITWVYSKLYLPSQSGKTKDISFHRLDTLDNPYVPDAEKERLLSSLSKQDIDIRLHGMFVHKHGSVYGAYFDRRIHVVPDAPIPKSARFYEGVDPGMHNFAYLFAYVDVWGNFIVYDELLLHEEPLTAVKEAIYEKRLHYRSRNEYTVADPMVMQSHIGNTELLSLRDQMATPPFPIYVTRLGNNDVEPGIFRVKEYLSFGKDRVTGLPLKNEIGKLLKPPRLYFMEKCHNTIFAMENYTYEPTKKNYDNTSSQHKDLPDCLRYCLMTLPSPAELDVERPVGLTYESYFQEAEKVERERGREEAMARKEWHPSV